MTAATWSLALIFRRFAFAVALLPALARATPPPGTTWVPATEELNNEVDNFFANYDVAMSNRRIEMVMAFHTSNASDFVFTKGHGARELPRAELRQRREEAMRRYVSPSLEENLEARAARTYLPDPDPNFLRIRQPVFRREAGVLHPSGDIFYDFVRSDGALKLKAVVREVESDDQPTPTAAMSLIPPAQRPLPTEVKLTNGVTLHQASVFKWYPDHVDLKHVGGNDPIRYGFIAPDQREVFEAHREAGIAQQVQAFNRPRPPPMYASGPQLDTDSARATIEQLQEANRAELEQAVKDRRLRVGMSKDQVRRAWGAPTRMNSVQVEQGAGSLWIYGGRGVDERGNAANVGVGFVDDIVVQLINVRK